MCLSSTNTLTQVQYNEILEYTEGWPEPNLLRTAAASVLFDKLVPCYALKRGSLLERLKDDLMCAVYDKYSPQVAADSTFFEHTPYFVSAVEAEKRQVIVDQRYDEMICKEEMHKSNSKIVRTVEGRNLENLEHYFQVSILKSWIDVVHRKKELVERLRSIISGAGIARLVKQLFQDWKLSTSMSCLWKMGQKILYYEEQIEIFAKEVPELAAEAKAKASALVQDVDDINLDDLMADGDENPESAALAAASRRPMTWAEKLLVMYKDVSRAKPFSKAHTLETIAEIFAAKLKHDAEQDRAGETRLPLPDFCCDYFLMLTGVGSSAAKRLSELIAGVRKYSEEHPRIRTFSYLINASLVHESWDPQAVNFLLCALRLVKSIM